jgi:hypothetical protein
MIWDECRESRGRVCVLSGDIHPWQDCVIKIRWQGCLPVASRTFLSEFRCIPFRPVRVRSDLTFRSFLEAATPN